MAKGNFKSVLGVVLGVEGAYSDNPHDNGGSTMRGITRKELAKWRGIAPWRKLPKSEVKNLTEDEATKIYRAKYWAPVKGDELPAGLDLSVFDAAVNSGPSRAIKWLQAVVGTKRDGWLGPETLAAIDRIIDMPGAINRFNDKRLGFVEALKSWKYFGTGWSRRIAAVRAKSITMWMQADSIEKPSQQRELRKHADAANMQRKVFGIGFFGAAFVWLMSLFGAAKWPEATTVVLFAASAVVFFLIMKIIAKREQTIAFKTELDKIKGPR